MPRRRKSRPAKRVGKWLILLILALLALVFGGLRSRVWDGKEKLILVQNRGEENVMVISFDPQAKRIDQVLIPGETEVLVAGQLGSWKLKSVLQLGINEGLGGVFLARTIAKNFGFPVYAWADQNGWSLLNRKTNLSLGDKLRLWFFTLMVNRDSRETVDLAQTLALKKTKFIDGETGYAVASQIPESVRANFIFNTALGGDLKAKIIDRGSSAVALSAAARLLQTVGLRVAAVVKENPVAETCSVSGRDEALRQRLAWLFGCRNKKLPAGENFDIVVDSGNDFDHGF